SKNFNVLSLFKTYAADLLKKVVLIYAKICALNELLPSQHLTEIEKTSFLKQIEDFNRDYPTLSLTKDSESSVEPSQKEQDSDFFNIIDTIMSHKYPLKDETPRLKKARRELLKKSPKKKT
ncbi:MAG: hypothetical protein JSS34_08840, partial [Proteobacteria bacterium]|nr:hypothetical protein [Pseudomonadota bacterium]